MSRGGAAAGAGELTSPARTEVHSQDWLELTKPGDAT